MPTSYLPRGKAAKTLVVAMALSVGAILYSHYAQARDKQVMKAGVERDKERLRALRKEGLGR